jgi:acyl carrier protein
MTKSIIKIIVKSLKELNEELGNKNLKKPTENTKLYGIDGVLDSLALVRLVNDLEEQIYNKFNKTITLADEKAMSQKNSPFKDVKTLAKYIKNLLKG